MTGRDALRERLALIVITDPAARLGVVPAVEAALRAGVRTIQLRWKDASPHDLIPLGARLRQRTRQAGALLIVNDRIDVALAIEADGAHLGDDDLPLEVARRIVPAHFILGKSVDTPTEAAAAERSGADYIGAGPVYSTASKSDTGPVMGPAGMQAIRAATRLPLVGIGGVGIGGSAFDVVRAGADGVAVIGAVMGADDPETAARSLLEEVRRAAVEKAGPRV
jgi:thiamine-phosphate pyrophosphorylase